MLERLNRTSGGMVSYFHVGIIVPDLNAAIARYQDMLGIRSTERATFRIPFMEDPHPHEAELVAAFSMTEPPYYELVPSRWRRHHVP